MYEYGKGVKQDLAKAVGWYQKAANQGQSWAQSSLVRLHLKSNCN
jgi:TPR repeat protein